MVAIGVAMGFVVGDSYGPSTLLLRKVQGVTEGEEVTKA